MDIRYRRVAVEKEKSHQGTHSWGLLNTLLLIPTTGIIKSTVWFRLPFAHFPFLDLLHKLHMPSI